MIANTVWSDRGPQSPEEDTTGKGSEKAEQNKTNLPPVTFDEAETARCTALPSTTLETRWAVLKMHSFPAISTTLPGRPWGHIT